MTRQTRRSRVINENSMCTKYCSLGSKPRDQPTLTLTQRSPGLNRASVANVSTDVGPGHRARCSEALASASVANNSFQWYSLVFAGLLSRSVMFKAPYSFNIYSRCLRERTQESDNGRFVLRQVPEENLLDSAATGHLGHKGRLSANDDIPQEV